MTDRRDVVLINTNEMQPPIAPLALDYIGDTLTDARYRVHLVDLNFAEDDAAIDHAMNGIHPVAVGLTFRNTDDCFLPSGEYFVPRLAQIVQRIRQCTDAPIVLGGCGYSIFPAVLAAKVNADFGIRADGELSFLQLVNGLAVGKLDRTIPGLVHRSQEAPFVVNPPADARPLRIPPSRNTIDNARYFRQGGMGNIETKRGCPYPCIYCADPVAKGRHVRTRDPQELADEVETLLRRGVDVLHLCDGEFNVPPEHAMAFCQALIDRGLGERVRWYAYATVHPFPPELAEVARRAGCVGINFGIDSANDAVLTRLRRGYQRRHIDATVRACQFNGIRIMLDLLIGAPGETPATVADSIGHLKTLNPDRVGAATGVRLYPGTPLAESIRRSGPLPDNPHLHGCVEDNADLLKPVFYIDRALGDDPLDLVVDVIGDDPRFFPPPRLKDATNYNYNDNHPLTDAIAGGHRGAYWDILRRLADGEPPL